MWYYTIKNQHPNNQGSFMARIFIVHPANSPDSFFVKKREFEAGTEVPALPEIGKRISIKGTKINGVITEVVEIRTSNTQIIEITCVASLEELKEALASFQGWTLLNHANYFDDEEELIESMDREMS